METVRGALQRIDPEDRGLHDELVRLVDNALATRKREARPNGGRQPIAAASRADEGPVARRPPFALAFRFSREGFFAELNGGVASKVRQFSGRDSSR